MRLPGICNFNPETTVLAHIRLGFGAIGKKPPDWCGVHACSACHDEIDGRTHNMATVQVRADVLRALCEQLQWYVNKGLLK